MKKQLLFTFCLALLTGIAFAQPKQKQPVKQAVSELKNLLSGTGLPFKVINDSLAAIPYGGQNISSYQVVVQKVSDLYIIYTNLTEAPAGKDQRNKIQIPAAAERSL